MPVSVQWPDSPALLRRLNAINAAVKPNSRVANRVKGDIKKLVIEDNIDKLLGRGNLEGVDYRGKPLARMADSTFRNPKRGFGPVLVPRGLQSRFITHFRATWEEGTLVMRWVGIVNSKGQSFVQYHLTGAKKAGTKWVLPRRDVAGITPKGWAKIAARHKKFAEDVLRGQE